jgi:hypothetical protein
VDSMHPVALRKKAYSRGLAINAPQTPNSFFDFAKLGDEAFVATQGIGVILWLDQLA